MMKKPKPWARGPLELIHHAEEHLKGNSDFDRRMVLVSFDNAIELSIITFLNLNPLQRNGWACERAQVAKWLHNFHSKLEFLEYYVISHLGQEMLVGRDELIYYHSIRNELYHNGNGFTPTQEIVEEIRKASNWVFLTLFGNHPSEHLSLSNLAEVEVADKNEDGLSSSTQMLQAVLEMKKMLAAYLDVVGGSAGSSLTSSIRSLVDNYSVELPEGLMAAAQKAESIRKVILDGDEPVSSDGELKALSVELKEHAAQIDSTLRKYQVELADASIKATLASVPPYENRKAGYIYQIIGTGRNMSITSYIVKARQVKCLERVPFVVLASHIVELLQLSECLSRHGVGHDSLRTCLPKNFDDLHQALSDPQGIVVFTTPARLRKYTPCHEGHCLLIGMDMQGLEFDLAHSIPNATLINFASSPLLNREKEANKFGDIIASFNYQSAVEQGVLRPVVLMTSDCVEVQSVAKEIGGVDVNQLIIKTLAEDAKTAGAQFRSIVVVNKISDAHKLVAGLQVALSCFESRGGRFLRVGLVSTVVEDRGRREVDEFNNYDYSVAVLVITSGSLAGLDLRNLENAYVGSPLQPGAQYKVASLLGRTELSSHRRIIDFARNEWNVLNGIE